MNPAETTRIVLEGEYDLTRKQEVESLFATLNGDKPLIIDVATVTYMDATILHQLGTLRLRNARRPIRLARANTNIRRVLHIVGFDQIFDMTDELS